MKNSFFLVAFTCLTLACAAWANEYYWPSSPRMGVKLKEQWIEFDRIHIRTYTLTLAGLSLELPYLAGFAVGPDDPRWNATFVIPEQPAIRFGLAGFVQGDFLPNASAASLKDYIAGLRLKGAKDLRSTADGTYSEDLSVGGIAPQVVEYTDGDVCRREYFLDIRGRIIVFAYQAPKKLFESYKESTRIVLARMNVMNLQEVY